MVFRNDRFDHPIDTPELPLLSQITSHKHSHEIQIIESHYCCVKDEKDMCNITRHLIGIKPKVSTIDKEIL